MIRIEIETQAYNNRRYGKPYIAVVEFSSDPKGKFTWGEWVGSPGSAGLLVINAEVGSIVAKGQKDFRGRGESIDWWCQVVSGDPENPDNLKKLTGKVEAYRLARLQHASSESTASAQ